MDTGRQIGKHLPTRARKLALTGLPTGKGRQILHALRHVPVTHHDTVLVADTDTRNPAPEMYRALLNAARNGASCVVADYRRYWDEGNLTHHVARPLLAATGIDLTQPLAGDIALSGEACARALSDRRRLPAELGECVDGYGVDAFLIAAAAGSGRPVTDVHLDCTKQHAPSFPHLPAIYQQAVPVLLAIAAARPPARYPGRSEYQLTERPLAPDRLGAMLTALDGLAARPPETATA
ncbi:hypothetical protein ACIQB5_47710 [Streptomyces sp. NPDC088560]|uniref:hypothetical protein n=1 Tax=Streptomyces sp. NPDC088560 TaxID=3365868 RepID=UPI00380791C8